MQACNRIRSCLTWRQVRWSREAGFVFLSLPFFSRGVSICVQIADSMIVTDRHPYMGVSVGKAQCIKMLCAITDTYTQKRRTNFFCVYSPGIYITGWHCCEWNNADNSAKVSQKRVFLRQNPSIWKVKQGLRLGTPQRIALLNQQR